MYLPEAICLTSCTRNKTERDLLTKPKAKALGVQEPGRFLPRRVSVANPLMPGVGWTKPALGDTRKEQAGWLAVRRSVKVVLVRY